jgi:hypothetical protein
LIGNGIGFRPLGKIVHSIQEVPCFLGRSMARALLHRRLSFSTGPLHCTDVFAPIPGSGTATGCTDVVLPAPLLNIISCLEPVVPLPDPTQGLLDSQVTS